MNTVNSSILNTINNSFAFVQDKFQNIVENSFILRKIDAIIFAFISLVLISSLFLPSEMIGLVACVVIGLTVFKLFLIKGQNINLAVCNVWIFGFIAFSIYSVANSTEPSLSLYGFTKTLIYMGFYFSLIQFFRYNKDKFLPVIYLIGILVSIEAVIGLFQNTLGLENISTWQDTSYVNPEDVLSRVYGTLQPYNPNLLAGYMISGFSAILAFIFVSLNNKKYQSVILGCVLALLSCLTIFFTGCRGAYVALFAIFIGVVLASWQVIFKECLFGEKLKSYWKYVVSSVGGAVVLVMVCTPAILKRILSIFILREDSSTSFRMNVYKSSLQMFQDNWLLGIGTGNKTFREVYGLYMVSGFDALSSYNVFLEIAVESGIFALIAYVGFLFVLLKNAVLDFINSKEILTKILIFTTAISVVGIMVHGLFDTIYFRPQVQFVFWTMVSILVVILQNKEEQEG
ncbi:MAG: O-antigen ligase family protein [Candidatus Gastranaerophilales bacterium]|nr:O-antigen ligase family protein [Candidatus Gastranaerophilales bacterium]